MENSEKLPSWGGKRNGAGRKKTTAKYYYFSATQEVHDILQSVEGSKSKFINDCILKAHGA